MNNRISQIDILKSLAILSVIVIHTIPRSQFKPAWFYQYVIIQAMPLFYVIMGFTLSKTMAVSPESYYRKKWDRLAMPAFLFILAAIVFYLIKAAYGINEETRIIGFLNSLSGNGFYFVLVLVQIIIIFPYVWKLYSKNPKLILILLISISFLFEMIGWHIPYYVYISAFPRVIGIVALGVWIQTHKNIEDSAFIISLGTVSILYLSISESINAFVWRSENMATYFYAATILLLSLQIKVKYRIPTIARYTYHIFLIQVLYFNYIHNHLRVRYGLIQLCFINILVCTIAGILYYFITEDFKFGGGTSEIKNNN